MNGGTGRSRRLAGQPFWMKWQTLGSVEDLVSDNNDDGAEKKNRRHLVSTSGLHMCAHSCVHLHTCVLHINHTGTQNKDFKYILEKGQWESL